MDYILHLLIIINIYIILSVSSNLLIGMVNLLSLGQAAFYGIGAYLTALFLIKYDLPIIPCVLLIMLLTGISGLIIAIPTLRLKGDYFVLGTLAFQNIVFSVLYNWSELTRGPSGIWGIPSPRIFGDLAISTSFGFFLLSFTLSLASVLFFYFTIKSPFGRILKAIREDEVVVISMGRNVVKFKIFAFVISSSFIGISGFLYASYISYIDPTSFNIQESIFILTAVIIGGSGNIRGPLLGAIFVVLIPELLRFFGISESIMANLRQVIYGLLIILIMRFRPQGIAGIYSLK